MAHPLVVSLGLLVLAAANPSAGLAQEPTAAPAQVAPEVTSADETVASPPDPASVNSPPPVEAPESAPAAVQPAPLTTPPSASAELSPWGRRLLMAVVTGAVGGAVVLVLGLVVATPLALLPALLPSRTLSTSFLGVPLGLLATGGLVATVLSGAVGISAVLQRFMRPFLGRQPSLLGSIPGALFFGGVGAALGLVGSYLLVTVPPDPVRRVVGKNFGDVSSLDARALAITGAMVVGLAVPMAALGVAIGGPLSAEVDDWKSVAAGISPVE